ncbi:MAG: ChrR family anti-sigma-E factor [Pseudomonadota bacterium]
MLSNHCPSEAWLLDYALGNTPASFEILMNAHVGVCDKCRSDVNMFENIGGDLLASQHNGSVQVDMASTLALAETHRNGVSTESRAVDAGSEASFDYFVRMHLNCSIGALPWRSLGGGLKVCKLRSEDDSRLWMLRAAPGTVLPRHSHEGSELTLVLTGAYFCGSSIYGAGDIEDADETIEHQPIVTEDAECICLAATEGPLRFDSWTARLIQPLIGI